MIDYLEDLLEEETAVELTGTLLTPVGRRRIPPWEEGEDSAGDRPGEGVGTTAENPAAVGEEAPDGRAGSPSWAEDQAVRPGSAAQLLTALTRAAQAAGAVRQQGRPLTVTLTGEDSAASGVDLNAMDRAVQRDARRYDGGFPLY